MLNMSDLTAKTTIYLDPLVKRFIQHKAIEEDRSVSDVVNDYFADMLEDLEDAKEVIKRRGEPTVSFEKVLSDMGLTYADLQD